jgi:hypothetical protein
MLPNLAMSKISQAPAEVPQETGHSPEAAHKAIIEVLAWEPQARLETHRLPFLEEQARCHLIHRLCLTQDSHQALDLPKNIVQLRRPPISRYQHPLRRLAQLLRL